MSSQSMYLSKELIWTDFVVEVTEFINSFMQAVVIINVYKVFCTKQLYNVAKRVKPSKELHIKAIDTFEHSPAYLVFV